MTRAPVRYEDYTLDDTQEALRDTVRQFFAKQCPSTVVRAAEPLGFDSELWAAFDQIGESLVGDDGATLVDLTLVAEEVGRVAAPVPFVSDVVARRLVRVAGGEPGAGPLTVALDAGSAGVAMLVPDAAAAVSVVARVDGVLGLHRAEGVRHVRNQGATALGWWTPGSSPVALADGPPADALHRHAVREWKLLTAAALVGLTETALQHAVEFVRERRTLGVPVGALQGVSFPLVDVAAGVASARHLVWRAAWYEDSEPGERPDLVPMAYAYACRVATQGTTAAAHFHGGLGFSLETDVGLFFLRAKGWSLPGGDPARDLVAVGAGLVARP